MKITMALDQRTYSGSPVDIVRKLRADAIHMKTRDADAYMRVVAARLKAMEQADIELDGDSLEERCESFLAGTIRSRMAAPVFQREHLDSASIRVLRRARGLTQERLAALLGVSFTTLNRWEAAEHLPSNGNTLKGLEEELFAYFWRPEDPIEPTQPAAPHAGRLLRARAQARSSFRPHGAHPGMTTHYKRT
jgi:DNA-binding transcriptional regulator YiaG